MPSAHPVPRRVRRPEVLPDLPTQEPVCPLCRGLMVPTVTLGRVVWRCRCRPVHKSR